jgi:superfamily II DNA helicase RecQ
MKVKIFSAGADGAAGCTDDLNGFLAGHRVLNVEKALVAAPSGAAYWTFVVTYLDGPAQTSERRDGGAMPAADRLDYKQELPPDAFARFVKLRDLRKRIAQDDGVPMYMVFTNAQLAAMARAMCASKADLRKIDGVGEARIEKYGARFLEEIATDEKGGQPAGGDSGAGKPEAGVLEGGPPQA